MSRIVYVWELGAGYGHLAAFYEVAKQLRNNGHEVVFVLKNLEHVDALLGPDRFEYLQGPVRWPTSDVLPPAFSYPGIMKNAGFDESGGLLARIMAWRALYQRLKPELLVFDHAPTALLAARGQAAPKALFGTGFYIPPPLDPLPSLRPWLKVPEKELRKIENQVLAAANSVLRRLDCPPLDALSGLFEADENFLCTFAELDHYPQRRNARYWGPSLYQTSGLEPQWPTVGSGKIFAYLNKDYPGLETLLQQLRTAPYSALIHIAGITPAFIQKHNGANLHLSPYPYNMAEVCRQSDLLINYGSAGTTAAFILAGKPMLILPYHLEQTLNAHRIAALGAGLYLPPETKKPNYRGFITEILSNAKYRQAAEAFANRYADFCPDRQANEIGQRCEALLAEGKQ